MTEAVTALPHGSGHAGHHDDGSKTVFGFWIYLMSDLLIFSVLFATFAVLSKATAGGPTGTELFDLSFVLVDTRLLPVRSFTFGMARLNLHSGRRRRVIGWLCVTFLFGAGFIGMEVYEFHHLITEGAGPQRSAYLSAFFTLIGTHGLHGTFGLVWIAVLIHMLAASYCTRSLPPSSRS